MQRHYTFCLLVLSFFCISPVWAADFSALKRTGSAQVLEVINPYTVLLNTGKVTRLAGLYYTDYTPHDAGPFATMTVRVLKDMLIGQKVDIYQTPKKDWGRTNRMGHDIAHLFITDQKLWVQGALLSLGLAKVQTTQRTPEMAQQMLEIEAAARADQSGLWEDEKILTVEEAENAIGTFAIVEGVIKSTAMKKNRLYLNFGGNWRDDFTVSVAPENRKAFIQKGENPLDWGKRRVRVRGFVERYNGPLIEIDHRAAIQILP